MSAPPCACNAIGPCAYHEMAGRDEVEAHLSKLIADRCDHDDGGHSCEYCAETFVAAMAVMDERVRTERERAVRETWLEAQRIHHDDLGHDAAGMRLEACGEVGCKELRARATRPSAAPLMPKCIHCCHAPQDCKWGGCGPCGEYCGDPAHRPSAAPEIDTDPQDVNGRQHEHEYNRAGYCKHCGGSAAPEGQP